MGSSSSILFQYKDHYLLKRGEKFFWVFSKDGKERSSMEVTVSTGTLDPVYPINDMAEGPLIYKNKNDNYQLMSENYTPTIKNLSYQLKTIQYYKVSRVPVWSKTFYVRINQ